jgi:predicted DsbA family dithiol-disulfide isomerase
LNSETVDEVLQTDAFADEVQKDMLEAQSIGVQGVPFFVFDAKYAISGAQHEETFLNTLHKVWEEGSFNSKVALLNTTDGDSCGVDGCD